MHGFGGLFTAEYAEYTEKRRQLLKAFGVPVPCLCILRGLRLIEEEQISAIRVTLRIVLRRDERPIKAHRQVRSARIVKDRIRAGEEVGKRHPLRGGQVGRRLDLILMADVRSQREMDHSPGRRDSGDFWRRDNGQRAIGGRQRHVVGRGIRRRNVGKGERFELIRRVGRDDERYDGDDPVAGHGGGKRDG